MEALIIYRLIVAWVFYLWILLFNLRNMKNTYIFIWISHSLCLWFPKTLDRKWRKIKKRKKEKIEKNKNKVSISPNIFVFYF